MQFSFVGFILRGEDIGEDDLRMLVLFSSVRILLNMRADKTEYRCRVKVPVT